MLSKYIELLLPWGWLLQSGVNSCWLTLKFLRFSWLGGNCSMDLFKHRPRRTET